MRGIIMGEALPARASLSPSVRSPFESLRPNGQARAGQGERTRLPFVLRLSKYERGNPLAGAALEPGSARS